MMELQFYNITHQPFAFWCHEMSEQLRARGISARAAPSPQRWGSHAVRSCPRHQRGAKPSGDGTTGEHLHCSPFRNTLQSKFSNTLVTFSKQYLLEEGGAQHHSCACIYPSKCWKLRSVIDRMTEYSELEGTHKDQRVQVLRTQGLNPQPWHS